MDLAPAMTRSRDRHFAAIAHPEVGSLLSAGSFGFSSENGAALTRTGTFDAWELAKKIHSTTVLRQRIAVFRRVCSLINVVLPKVR